VVEEGTFEGEVAGLNPAGSEAHEFCTKNVATCDLRACDNEEAWLIVRIRSITSMAMTFYILSSMNYTNY
jgi:hypothetical protein